MADKRYVIQYFQALDGLLTKKTNIYILGGCYFLLQHMKPASPDIDILVDAENWTAVNNATKKLTKAFRIQIDIMQDGWLDSFGLPEHFRSDANRYRRYRSKFSNIKLWTLSPYDILISKVHRWKPKDVTDVKVLLEHKTINRRKLENRIRKSRITRKKVFEKNYAAFYKRFGDELKESKWF